MYSEKVMDHFTNPRNVGEMKDANGVGEIGSPVCGDTTRVYIKVKDNIIEDIKFKTYGCSAAIASSSMLTEMVKGKTLEEALEVTDEAVAEALDGLPPQKLHCSNMAASALHKAIEDYQNKNRKAS
ncbi:MAG: nitrogen fixation protein NifU [Clostridia bacterium]|nr:nitrogen fixation protein NifU [Clostridia bacterium]